MNNESRVLSRRNFLKVTGGSMLAIASGATLGCSLDRINNSTAENIVKNEHAKKILVLTGSPHRNGTTALLAEQFIQGAKSKGHLVNRFDSAFENVKPCNRCEYCKENSGKCIFEDAMERLSPELVAADVLVLVTPIYYFGMTRQLKCVIERFYSQNVALQGKKSTMLLAASGSKVDWVMDGLLGHYKCLCRYMKWEDQGSILAAGCPTREHLLNTSFPELANTLGASV
ncbi:flavodoxin family protein [Bacteroides sp.]|uniref:flavodoxin family protein n=1 Tax=Bacteroides sp. TaxID=29523 RepID=UPI00261C7891|nr:flavodoxin family protein [Bacteroides sp.]MDD3040842.1 flavodoxin family protein [Bacteroides sp.]